MEEKSDLSYSRQIDTETLHRGWFLLNINHST